MPASIDPRSITGLLLAGGRGSRMGGRDKGLQPYRGRTLAQHALQRLAPQVGALLISANRNLSSYAALGAPICSDAEPDYPGPLAGFLSGLDLCRTPYLVTVPCDSPLFPLDLVARLSAALQASGAELAIPITREADGTLRRHPVFCLMKGSVRPGLEDYVVSGRRKLELWARSQRCVEVPFEDAQAFANINTLDDLQALKGAEPPLS
ncbi:molybdenum cofactor guanylyltransferase MobA [Pelomonas sp. V22]|uniref:molybdenum cofactor guanylyltransferase MobA n=1 Tax=Pelomonas sp. V22 TaxID=2822139 RepID=UPI0024A90672|nr:molybdenum cofactor guanylyltransferase MobA [Pelomonas sp. V22]MDI4632399.1 molybdenum cofactor guanylyltransferase MobA [Pelomonas sp. V22]